MESEDKKEHLKEIFENIQINFTDKYKGFYVSDKYNDIAESIENFEVFDDDIWVCSFPKSGTTWAQEMVWNIANDCKFIGTKELLVDRFPYLEYSVVLERSWSSLQKVDDTIPDRLTKSVEYVAKKSRPRFIKTHLPFHLLPRQIRTGEKKPKLIYVIRNPKDVCISYYNHFNRVNAYRKSFEDHWKLFLTDKLMYCPYWANVISYWREREDKNILILKFEDMKKDLPSVIRRASNFLGKPALSDEEMNQLKEHLSFTSMKNNPAVNNNFIQEYIKRNNLSTLPQNNSFYRKGEVGQWKTDMSVEAIEKFDAWINENLKDFKDLQNVFS